VRDARGFTLLEVLIAVSLLATGASAVAYLTIAAGRTVRVAQQADVVQSLAREKLEQLRMLAWTSDGALPVSDWSSDVSATPIRPTAGKGLGASPGDTLVTNVDGYADFADAGGRSLGGGADVPPAAAWIRRWSVQPMPSPPDTLFLQVIVIPSSTAAGPVAAAAAARAITGAWLVDIRTRKAR